MGDQVIQKNPIEQTEKKQQTISIGMRIVQNVSAFFIGGILAYFLMFLAQSGIFTADLMNQYGQVVDSLSGSEMLVDITTGGMMHLKTTKNYTGLQGIIFTIYYDDEKLSIDYAQTKSPYAFVVTTGPNTVNVQIHTPTEVKENTLLVSIPYTGKDARWVQTHTPFVTVGDFGDDYMEDLVTFTYTPPNPFFTTGQKMRE